MFRSSPLLTPIGKSTWILKEELVYEDENIKVVIPLDFITDFASVPRLFWSILPPWGRYGRASIAHDYFYKGGVIYYKKYALEISPTRYQSDRLFRMMMQKDDVDKWKWHVMYYTVRCFGSKRYD